MTGLKQLSGMDVLFIAGENAKVYHHTAGLVILDASSNPDMDFEHLRERTIERMDLVPHFRWKLHEVPLGLDLPYWVEDENFSYDNHFKRIAVPSPGDRQALGEVAAHLYSRHLDRSKPLWEMWFIEGLEGGKIAIMQKLHHAMMDGQGAEKLGELLCDFSPEGRKPVVDSDIANARPGAVPNQSQWSAAVARRWMQFPLASSRGIFDFVRSRLERRAARGGRDAPPKPELPKVRFNADISADRGFVFGTVPLDDIKRIKDAFGVTVNDVVLALVGSTLRAYLQRRGELPSLSLRCGIAVSLRSEEDKKLSNQVTQVSVTLATELEDPIGRLRAINEETEPAKREARDGGMGLLETLQLLPPFVVHGMVNSMTAEQAADMIGANLVVSNVRGSPVPMYIAGARLECMYPMSILTTGMGINVTCVSYADGVDFGFCLAPELFDEPWELIDGLDEGLAEYLALIPGKKPARKSATSKRKTSGKAAAKRTSSPARKTAANKAGAKKPAKRPARAKAKAKTKTKTKTKTKR